jgi:tetratricopeptide (TPR) repeat protein
MPYVRKISKKQQLKQPDEFLSLSARVAAYAEDHVREILIGAGGALLLVGVGAALYFYQHHLSEQALLAYYEGERLYRQGRVQEWTATGSGASETYQQAAEAFERTAREYPRTPSAAMAHYQAGNSYVRLREYDKAIAAYQECLRKSPKGSAFVTLATQRLAYTYLAKQAPEETLRFLDQGLKIEEAGAKDLLYMEAGRILEKMGQPEKAVERYRRVVTDFPLSQWGTEAKAKLDALEKKGS